MSHYRKRENWEDFRKLVQLFLLETTIDIICIIHALFTFTSANAFIDNKRK